MVCPHHRIPSIPHILYRIEQRLSYSARLAKVRSPVPYHPPYYSPTSLIVGVKQSLLQRLRPGRSSSPTPISVVRYRAPTSPRHSANPTSLTFSSTSSRATNL